MENTETTVRSVEASSLPARTGTMADTILARMLLDSAEASLALLQYDSALALSQSAQDIYLNTVGESDTLMIRALTLTSETYLRNLNLEKASAAAQKALEIAEADSLENHSLMAAIFNSFGLISLEKRKTDKAIDYFQMSLEILQKNFGEKNYRLAPVYKALGEAYDQQGEYKEALIHLFKSEEIYKGNKQKDGLHLAKLYNAIGNTYENRGDLEPSITYLQKSLNLYRKSLGDGHFGLAGIYNSLGNTYERIGAYGQASHYLHKSLSLKLKKSGPTHPHVGDAYFNIAIVCISKKEFERALEYIHKSLAIDLVARGPEHPYVADSYNSLGVIYDELGELEKALNYYLKSLAIKLKTQGKNHPNVSVTYTNIGVLYQFQEQYEKAIEYYEKSLKIKLKTLGKNNPEFFDIYNSLGDIYINKGDFEKGLAYQHQAMQILKYDPSKPTQFDKVVKLVSLKSILESVVKYHRRKFQATGNVAYQDSLYKQYKVLLALEDFVQGEFSNTSTREYYASRSLPVYEGAIGMLFDRNKPGERREMFQLAEKTKSRRLAEKLQSIAHKSSFGLPDSLAEKEKELELEIVFFEKQAYQEEYYNAPPNDSLLRSYRSKIFDLRNKRTALLELFKAKYPKYYNLRYSPRIISLPEVQKDILRNKNQALVEYFVGDTSLYIFTVLKDTFHIDVIKKDFPLKQWIKDFRCGLFSKYAESPACDSLEADNAPNLYADNAFKLYKKLFAPIQPLLSKKAEVIIIPDGILGYLPFEALLTHPVKEGEGFYQYSYLLRDHVISYAYSATLLQEMQDKQHQHQPSGGLLAFAPDFGAGNAGPDRSFLASRFIDTSKHRNWLSPLKFNIPEAENVAAKMDGEALTGPAATEAAFLSRAQDYRILHLSTHGKANDQIGDYSFLAFHQTPEDSIENEWLYNQELYNLQLNADLVVLSACETGIGELRRGEGIISLARGFSYAGAKSIVTSLWNVNDQSSKILMEYFYDNLKKGMPKNQALHQAKLDFLSRDNLSDNQRSPFFWAAFIPIGDMAPIEMNGAKLPLLAWGGFLMIILLGIWWWRRNRK